MSDAHLSGGGGVFFADPDRIVADLNTVHRAARERWPVPDDVRRRVASEVADLAMKRTTTVGGTSGPITVDNDRNQIAAARVLAFMVAQNQADEHHADKQNVSEADLALRARDAALRLTDEEKIAYAIQLGRLDLLSPRLREEAQRRIGATP